MELITKLTSPEWWRLKCLEPRGGLFFISRNVLMTMESSTPGYQDLYVPTHKRLCNFIETYATPGNKLLILMPRGWVKSYLTGGWLIQRIIKNLLMGKRETWILNNATLENAILFLDRIKYNFENNDLLRGLYRDVIPKEPAAESEKWTERVLSIGGNRIETGSAEGNLVSRHYPGGILNDDLVNRENSQTRDQIVKVIDFWRLCQSLMLPQAIEFIPGTRWNYDDLYGHIMEEHLKIPEADMKRYREEPYFEWHRGRYHMFHCSCWADPVREKGTTFPMYPEERIKELKSEQGERFGGQYLNDPLALSQSKFKDFFFAHPWKSAELPDKKISIMLCDPAGKDKADSDYTGLVVVDAGLDKVCYVRSAVRKRLTDSKACEWIISTALRWKPVMIGVEENKFGTFKELIEFLLPEMSRKGLIPGDSISYAKIIPNILVELKHHSRRKTDRIANLAGYFEQGLLRLGPSGMQDLKDELLRHPTPTYDDLSDALAYLYDIVYYPKPDDPIIDLRDIAPEYKMTTAERLKKEWEEDIPAIGRAGGFDIEEGEVED